jgi:hypothetical protein
VRELNLKQPEKSIKAIRLAHASPISGKEFPA